MKISCHYFPGTGGRRFKLLVHNVTRINHLIYQIPLGFSDQSSNNAALGHPAASNFLKALRGGVELCFHDMLLTLELLCALPSDMPLISQ